jgi:peroxiredoxin
MLLFGAAVNLFKDEARAEMAPDFQLVDLDNNLVSLSGYRQKQPVIVFFWTTWCPYCLAQLKALNDKYPALKEKGWEILAIDIDDPDDEVRRVAKNNNLSFKVLLEGDTTVAEDYQIYGVPAYFIVDKEGKISYQGTEIPGRLLDKMLRE